MGWGCPLRFFPCWKGVHFSFVRCFYLIFGCCLYTLFYIYICQSIFYAIWFFTFNCYTIYTMFKSNIKLLKKNICWFCLKVAEEKTLYLQHARTETPTIFAFRKDIQISAGKNLNFKNFHFVIINFKILLRMCLQSLNLDWILNLCGLS